MTGGATPASDRVLHREGGRLWPLVGWLAVGAGAFVVLYVTRGEDAAAVSLVVMLVTGTGVVSYVLGRWLYWRVTVTPESLSVGRDRIPLADLDADLLYRQAHGELSTVVPDGVFTFEPTGVRMVGGSKGPHLFDRHLIVAVRGREGLHAVPTRDPQRLAQVVLQAKDMA